MVGLLGSILSQESPAKSGDTADKQSLDEGQAGDANGFAEAYSKNIDSLSSAKTGKHMPDATESSRNAEHHNGLTSKTLKGGMQIIIGGNEPTPEGVDQYAELQGIDEQLLSLLMTHPNNDAQPTPIGENPIVVNQPSANNSELEIDRLISKHLSDSSASLNQISGSVALDALKADISALMVRHTERLTQSEGVKTPSSQSPSVLNALKADIDALIIKHVEQGIADKGVNGTLQQPMAKAAMVAFKDDIEALVLKRHPSTKGTFANPEKIPPTQRGLVTGHVVHSQANQKGGFQPQALGVTFRGGSGVNSADLQLRSETRTIKGEHLNKVIEAPNAKQIFNLAQNSAHRIKLPSIDLSRSAGEVTPISVDSWIPQSRLSKIVGAGESGGMVLAQTFVNNVTDVNSQANTRADEANLSSRDHLQRQEQYLDISRRLSEALGQRLSSQIQRGAWQVELDLHPKSMGRIEVYLEMKNGELDAVFNASKSIARELLQDSIPRLRAELDQHGIPTSYLGLSDGSSRGAGDQGMNQNGNGPDGQKSLVAEEKSTPNEAPRSKLSGDGLDIIV